MLNAFLKPDGGSIVVLEIDPVTNELTAARLRFYKQCGFYTNPYPHRHPAYGKRYAPHHLTVLSSARPLHETEYQAFNASFNDTVIDLNPNSRAH